MTYPDQKKMWDEKHGRGEHAAYKNNPMQFAVNAEEDFSQNSRVLDMGCGIGADARYFASKGHLVEAIDFSEVVIEQNSALSYEGVNFAVVDISQTLPYKSATFDVVYAHLSIHYFSDTVTKKVVDEVSRILKPHARFYFRCKSIDSHEKDDSTEIEPRVYVSNSTGHIRHLFSEDYVRELLHDSFDITKLIENEVEYAGKKAFVIDLSLIHI